MNRVTTTTINQPVAIKMTKRLISDVYEGTREQLIAAGIVREDQLPPAGRFSISYSRGKVIRCNPPKDETYLRIECYDDGRCRAHVGVPREVSRARKAAEKACYRDLADDEASKRKEKVAAHAAASLAAMPRSKADYRLQLVTAFRRWAMFSLQHGVAIESHGFSVNAESMEAIKVALDGVVDAILDARLEVDQDKQLATVMAFQTAIAAGDPGIARKVAQLLMPDSALLAGDPA